MRKTIYIVLAALGLCLFAGCGSSDKEKVSPLVKQLAGEWQLKTWNGEAPRDFDAYVSFGADRSFEIYQRIEQVGYQKYSGKYEIRNGMLGGVYSDGKPFGSTYDITFDESGNTLTLTAREQHAVFTNHCIETVIHLIDEVHGVGHPRRFFNLLTAVLFSPCVSNVVSNRIVKQMDILRHQSNLVT